MVEERLGGRGRQAERHARRQRPGLRLTVSSLTKARIITPPCSKTQVLDVNLHNNTTGEVIQTMENVTNFLQGVQALGVPADYLFDVSDIEDQGPTERPRVVACLMALKRLSEGKGLTGDYSTPARNPLAGFQARRASYHYAAIRHGVPAQSEDFSFEAPSICGEFGEGEETPPLKLSAGKGVQAAVGVTKLMQQCTTMLRERMWADSSSSSGLRTSREFSAVATPTPPRGAATPEGALEAMGPVLESVLGSLTQEYEKRLLAKVTNALSFLQCFSFLLPSSAMCRHQLTILFSSLAYWLFFMLKPKPSVSSFPLTSAWLQS
jgi:hypothetical protein